MIKCKGQQTQNRIRSEKMRRPLKLLVMISVLFLFPVFTYSQNLGELRISLIDGDVQIRTEDTGDWVPASINMPLREGDRIWVPEGGKTELQLSDGTYLRLSGKSALEILTLDQDSSQFYLNEGRVYVNFIGRKGTLLQMDTPLSSNRAYGRSIFRVDLLEDGFHQISVFKGSVDTESKEGRTTINSGYTLTLKEETYAELSPLGPPDGWEKWNTERDRRMAEWRPPSPYLPEELYAYAGDFEENGRWVHVREYGYVWTPTVVVSVGWAPYRIGRWVWIAGDYVWISYEPWGWVPYHYGRWAFVASIGWCWVPPGRGAVFWGPGFVAWVRTPTYVAWVPLAPREIYYGRGHYGPYSVNITQVNVTSIRVNKAAYKNIYVRNAVTVVHHDTFVMGKHVDVKVKENLFLKEKISIGRPDIKPVKATSSPVIKNIPEAKRPPEPIQEIRVRELKEKRPLERERNVSVLRPESPPKEMPLKVKPSIPRPEGSLRVAPGRGSSPSPPKTGSSTIERSKEGKPVEKEFEKPKESRPSEKSPEKSRESKLPEGKVEKPKELKPVEKVIEKPRVVKPEGKGMERPPESSSPEMGSDKHRESRPPEKGVEKSQPIEKPKEVKPGQRGVAKQQELRPTERAMEKPVPVESPKEAKPTERRAVKPKEPTSPEKGLERPMEPRPAERGVERPRETKPPEKGVEKPNPSRPSDKGIERQRELQTPERRIEKSRPPEVVVQEPREPQSMERKTGSPKVRQPAGKGEERVRESNDQKKQ
jgi:hypothetical protein